MSMPWRTPTDDLNASHRKFHQVIKPQCERFIVDISETTDDERHAEHSRLTELITKLILFVDGLALATEPLKQKRKALIVDAQELTVRLDESLDS